MCGIAGWLGYLPDAETYAARMEQAMRHRGPDGHGAQLWTEAGLVHTRLSIIDLSAAGAQPITNEDQNVWAVFNGEIYNHKELRHNLKARGHVFKGYSDAEVLPHLYEEEGPEFINKVRGMFAFASYDTRTRTLILARDRFGIKPLFYAPGKDRLAFASEIIALKEIPGIDLRPDRQAIYDFAALSYIPAPETFYRGIRALQPGEILEARVDTDGISCKIRKYHKWIIVSDSTIVFSDAVERANELVAAAVKNQLESDVPIGALLSGGIDSSIVSSAAQDAMGGGLRTFNVRFPEKEYDETWAAVAVAKHIESHHETLDIEDGQGTWDHITSLLRHAGQPFADTSLFALSPVCRLMRRRVTVALSGDGGDEGFGGYNFYWQIASIARWQVLPKSLRGGSALALSGLAHYGIAPRRLGQRLQELAGADDTSIIQNLFCWVRDQEHRNLCRDVDLLPVRRLFQPQWECHFSRGASRLERLSAHATEVNIRLMLPDDFLYKVDTASMRESLEVRVPMLDEDLFAFGLSLPHHLKVAGRMCKRVLRAVAERRLPLSVANKPKRGFEIPVDSWVNAHFKECLRDALLGPSSELPEFFRPEAYRPMVAAFCEGHPHPGVSRQGLYQRAVMLLSVHLSLNDSHRSERASDHGAMCNQTSMPRENERGMIQH
jgi:asparagine synthase (glutamine-hydrolysing)